MPLWIRCLVLGMGISWLVAVAHWILVETGVRPREVFDLADNDVAGATLVEHAYRATNGLPPRGSHDERYYVIAYGWPVRNWGTMFREAFAFPWQAGVRPVWAIELRSMWAPSGRTTDPRHPEFSPAAPPPPYSSGVARVLMFSDPYERYFPAFPLIGHSMLASGLYGLPFYVWFKRRELRARRGRCDRCGYDLNGLRLYPAVCPECGPR